MAGQTTPELVAAVSNAGGLGILGATRISDVVRKIKMITTKPYGVNLWLGPQEKREKKDHDISSVQQFLDQKFRKPLGLPLKSVSSLPEHDTTDLPPPSKLSEQLQIILEEKVPNNKFCNG